MASDEASATRTVEAQSIAKLQRCLAEQEPREQVHYLMRILPEQLRQRLRGQREGVDFYVGEIIGTASEPRQPPAAHAEKASTSVRRNVLPPMGTTPAERHPHWPALQEICQSRRHGWQHGQHGPTRVGPRRLEKQRAMLAAVKERALVRIANGLAIPVPHLLMDIQSTLVVAPQSQ